MTSDDHRIRLLSDHVANKIAAGEVVDRPASVLKELMENALDAGATQVDVEIVAGGRKTVQVSDNGRGMSRDDAILSVERHATSKIRDVEDIEAIETLGFRGEALAAISAVSRFTLVTRSGDDEGGTEIQIAGGKVQDVRDVGAPPGTTMTVRQLFFNVPARRRFVRTEQTESAYARQTFLLYALAHPEVGMSLKMDGRMVHQLNAGATRLDRIREVFGRDTVAALRAVDYELQHVCVTGFVGLPHLARKDKSEQYVFVNSRPAAVALISYAIQEGYQTLIPKGRYAMVFIYIDIDPKSVDVNVHPTKKEVRFRQPILVRDTVIEGVREALAQATESASMGADARAQEAAMRTSVAPRLRIEELPELQPFSYPRIPMAPSAGAGQAGTISSPPESDTADQEERLTAPWAQCRVLGQVGGLYVVLETDEGLVLMDPHAAHERVLYERFMREVLEDAAGSQGLLVPETVELTPKDALVVRNNLKLLSRMGFGISEFGGDAFVVDALPKSLGNASPAAILPDVATGLERGGARGGTERWAEQAVAQAACKAAVKANDRLKVQEVEQLVIDLAGAEMPYTCPHGRPTVILMSYAELDRKFGRT